jgi:hypothetical protein
MRKTLLTSALCLVLAPLPSLAQVKIAACGKERRAVKTLADPLGEKVASVVSTPGRIAELVTVGAPTRKALLTATARRFPQEKIVYRVSALVVGSKLEMDSDFHMVLADPSNARVTLIAEIPSENCVAPVRNTFFANLRAKFSKDFEKPAPGKLRKLAQPAPACVVGVGFFDFLHGQDGVAPNGFELHPVLSVTPGLCSKPEDAVAEGTWTH